MSDLDITGAAPTTPSVDTTEPSKPVTGYSSFTRTEKPTQGAVSPRTEERLPDPDRVPSRARRDDGPSSLTEGQRLAAAARREQAAAQQEARAKRAGEWSRNQRLAAMNPQERQQYVRAENQQIIREYHASTLEHVRSNPDLELTNLLGMQEQVPQLIYSYWQRTRQILPTQVAAQAVEDHLRRQLDAATKSRAYQSMRAKADRGATPVWNPDNRPLDGRERYRRSLAVLEHFSKKKGW